MSRTFVCDLSDGDTFHDVLLVRDKQVRTNRNGTRYLQVELDDRSGGISGRHWNSSEGDIGAFQAGDFILVDGKVQLFQSQLQLIIHSFRRIDADSVRLVDFLPCTDKDVDQLVQRLREILDSMSPGPYRAIAQSYMVDQDFVEQFRRAPAGIRNHHAYMGGLLEHVVALLELALRVADLYPQLHRDLFLLGVLLHDSGKVRELQYDRLFAYTDEGQLLGHLVQGVEMLNEKLPLAAEIYGEAIPDDVVAEVKHIILSHHGQYEFGSPKLPMSLEAIAIHYIDNLDARIHNFGQRIRESADPNSRWSAFDPSLGRRIYKGSARGKTGH
jgi:3'-5' exoribonuclease